MAGYLIRTLIAVVAVIVFYALLPPVAHIIGFTVTGDLYSIIKIVVGVLAIIYIFWGPLPSKFNRV